MSTVNLYELFDGKAFSCGGRGADIQRHCVEFRLKYAVDMVDKAYSV